MSPFAPWTQQVRGARYGEEPPTKPPQETEPWWAKLFGKSSLWSPSTGFQPAKWAQAGLRSFTEPQPPWMQAAMTIPGIGGIGGTARGIGKGLGAAYNWIGQAWPKNVPAWAKLGALGGAAAYTYQANQPGEEPLPPSVGTEPYGPTIPPSTIPILPQPGEDMGEQIGPEGQPEVIEIGGQTFWWNPTGGMYGTGGWDLIPARTQGLTPEEQIRQAELDRQAALERTRMGQMGTLTPEQQMAQAEAERQANMERIRLQYQLEQQGMAGQFEQQRQMQAAAAAQQMAQMYAADPYKYWAQMGQGTPGAVARLTGGRVAPGEQMGRVPLSTPSAQWWGNLLPSEQQQISGGLNWLGVNPEDWYSIYQRMIPGLGQRQMEPQWMR